MIVYRNITVCMMQTLSLLLKLVSVHCCESTSVYDLDVVYWMTTIVFNFSSEIPVLLHCRKASSVCWEPTEMSSCIACLYAISFVVCVSISPSVSEFSFNTSRSAYFSRGFLKSAAVCMKCVYFVRRSDFICTLFSPSRPSYEQPVHRTVDPVKYYFL